MHPVLPALLVLPALPCWWNVWDHADLLSFRAAGIIEGVDDSPFFASGSLATDHYRYLANAEFYRALGERVAASLEKDR